MYDINDYIKWRGDIELEYSEFNPVDSLVLSQLSYIKFEKVLDNSSIERPYLTIKEVFDILYKSKSIKVKEYFNGLSTNLKEFIYNIKNSKRFKNMKLLNYINDVSSDEEKQFSAITIILGDGTSFIAYRGTDNTIVGWKEDFNMSFITPIPSQIEAVEYLNRTLKSIDGLVRVGGHSKGGNLAIYAAVNCNENLENRIIEIYSHDGPGISNNILESKKYSKIKNKIKTYLPQSSIVGMILGEQEPYNVVSSNKPVLKQHDPFAWEVTYNDFLYANKVDDNIKVIDSSINKWLSSLSNEERRKFIDLIFEIISSTNAKTLSELKEEWKKNQIIMLKALKNMKSDNRKMIIDIVKSLLVSMTREFHDLR